MKKFLRYVFLSLFLATSLPNSGLLAMEWPEVVLGGVDEAANHELKQHLKEDCNQLLAYSRLPVGSHNVAGQTVVVDQNGGVTVSKGLAKVTFPLQKIHDNYVPTSEQASRWLKALAEKKKSRDERVASYPRRDGMFADLEYLKLFNEPILVEENGLIIQQIGANDFWLRRGGKINPKPVRLQDFQREADKKQLMKEIPAAKLCAWLESFVQNPFIEKSEEDGYSIHRTYGNELDIQEKKSGLNGNFSKRDITKAQMCAMIDQVTPEVVLNALLDEKNGIKDLDHGDVTIVGYKFTKKDSGFGAFEDISIEAPAGVDGSMPYVFECNQRDLAECVFTAFIKKRITPIDVVKRDMNFPQEGISSQKIKIENIDLAVERSYDGTEIEISLGGIHPVPFRIKDAKRELLLSRPDFLAQIRAQADNNLPVEYDFGEGVKMTVTKAEGLLFFDGDNFFEIPLDPAGPKPVDPNKKTKNNWSKAELATAGARFVALMIEQQLRRVYGADSKLVLASGIALDLCRIANDILFVAPEFKTAAGISTMPWVAVDLYDIVKKACKLLGSKKQAEKLKKDVKVEVKSLKSADKLITFFRAAAPTLEGVLALSRAGVRFSSSMNIQKIAPFAAVLLSVVRSLDMMANAGEDNIQKKLSYLMFGVSALGGIIEVVQYVRTPVVAK